MLDIVRFISDQINVPLDTMELIFTLQKMHLLWNSNGMMLLWMEVWH